MSRKPSHGWGRVGSLALLVALIAWAEPAQATPTRPEAPPRNPATIQQDQQQESVAGRVVSVQAEEGLVVLETSDDELRIFMDAETEIPADLQPGDRVTVWVYPGPRGRHRIATRVRVDSRATRQTGDRTESADAGAQGGAPGGQGARPQDDVVPREVRQAEAEIERAVERFQVGVRSGWSLDPELVAAGVHAHMGPFFVPGVFARPSLDAAFGQVTTQYAVNLEFVYYLPMDELTGDDADARNEPPTREPGDETGGDATGVQPAEQAGRAPGAGTTSERSRWSLYFGGGPAVNFYDRDFEGEEDEEVSIDDIDIDTGLNLLMGLAHRNGMFLELKAGAYGSPAMKVFVGYSF